MFKRRNLYAVLGVVGALALLLTGLGGMSTVSAEEVVDEIGGCGLFSGGGGWLGVGGGSLTTTFDAMAQALGLEATALFERLYKGETVADIAEEEGVGLGQVQEVVEDARVEARKQAIEQAMDEESLSQEQGELLLDRLKQDDYPGGGFRKMGGGLGGMKKRGFRSAPEEWRES